MQTQNRPSRTIMGVVAVFLWGFILTIFLVYACSETGFASVIKPTVLAVVLVVIGFLIYQLAKARRFTRRLNDASGEFMIRRDVDAYFAELAALEEMNGGRPIGKMLEREFFDYQRIFALKNAGRKEEARALLETAMKEAKTDRALLLLKAEETHWD